MAGNLRGRIQQVDGARGDSDDEVEAFIRGEAMPVRRTAWTLMVLLLWINGYAVTRPQGASADQRHDA
jgi:hypothetical protein